MPKTTMEEVALHYDEAGSGDPPFLFVHGWCCDNTYFHPQFDHFSVSSRVVSVDLRGFGKSATPEGDYSIATFAADLASLCGELGLTKPIVVGHSMGGAVAIELAARRPDLVGAVVAVDPAPIDPPDEMRGMLRAFVDQIGTPEGDAAQKGFIENFLFIPTDDAERKARIVEHMGSAPKDISQAAMRGIAEWDGGAAMRSCNVPTLILLATIATNDPARLVALKPDVQLGLTVGAGHFNMLEVPEQVTPMIERFLRCLPSTG